MNERILRHHALDFLEKAFEELEQNSFALDEHWHIDHLCYRTSSQENYLYTKKQLEHFCQLLIESEVNGRLISTFKLATPIVFESWEIDLIEVPAPKPGKITPDGFEHFEIVCDLTLDEIKSRYPQCHFDDSGLAKDFNQELEVNFRGFAVKFHPISLESVINVEGNLSAFSALKKSEILKILKPFSPLVAGSFPLNVNTIDSDIDIVISGDLGLAKKVMQEKFGDLSTFKLNEITVRGEPTLLASIFYEGIKLEIFGQRTPSVKQQGYLHFLIEERLLKVGGNRFIQKVKQARAQGLKTEPAFANALGLKGDAFEELLLLQKQSGSDLKALMKMAGF